MIPEKVKTDAEEKLSGQLGTSLTISAAEPIGGGCIHNAHRVDTTEGAYFLKWNRKAALRNFQAEAKGLALLAEADAVRTPRVLHVGPVSGYAYLMMEFISESEPGEDFWQVFGRNLAKLHANSSDQFGLDYNNFIGSLDQSNTQHATWIEFYVAERLEKQLKMATDRSLADRALLSSFNKLFGKIDRYVPEEKPALLHGDLWSGNFMTGDKGGPVVFDPAVYYGHREAEIAFTKLFGGFDAAMYTAYEETFPLQEGWKDRVDLFNLYPLLVHFNLFGAGYRPQIESALKRFI